MRRIFLAAALLALAAPATAAPRPLYAKSTTTCDGWPRLPIETAKGFCAGLVIGPSTTVFKDRRLHLPRTLVMIPGTRDWLVVDLGAWVPGKGSVQRMSAEPGKPVVLTPLVTNLSMPHGVSYGPDGRAYVGEMSRIIAFDPTNPKATLTSVITGLPDNRLHENRHPLSSFIFDADGSLIVNVGAPSDQCDKPASRGGAPPKCLESEGAEPTGVLRRYPYLGKGKWSPTYTVIARGLRNSLALVRHESGALYQAENSYDFDDRERPFEELNRIVQGRHYGWPYCYDMDKASPAWAGSGAMDCASSAHTKPLGLLPPHAAPLMAIYYKGAMFPELQGRMLMSWHGWRTSGARLVALEVDADGAPKVEAKANWPNYTGATAAWRPYVGGPGIVPRVLTPGWQGKTGVRPEGAPVGMAVAPDGAIWVAEDRNGTIVRFARDRP
jgi:glucose/arabinose dehydrogenase